MRPTTTLASLFLPAALAASTLALLPSAPAGAAVTPSCSSTRLTDVPAGYEVSDLDISGDGTAVAFATLADLGQGASGNAEVYTVDTTSGAITPVTATVGATQDSIRPDLDHDGDTIALLSEASLVNANVEGDAEVYRGTLVGGTWGFERITTTPGAADNRAPAISADGSTIVYQSRQDGSFDNADLNHEVFRWIAGDGTAQITTSTDDVGVPAQQVDLDLADDGYHVYWTSTAPDGQGDATNTSRLVRADSYGITDDQEEAPAATRPTFAPSAGRDRWSVAFVSAANLGPGAGSNPDGNAELWLRTEREPLGSWTDPLTSTSAAGDDENGAPSLNDPGSVVAFETTAPALSGADSDFPSVVRQAGTGGTTVLDGPADAARLPTTSAIGHVIAYLGIDDGAGGDGSADVYVARCRTFTDVGTGHTFWEDVEWAASEGITTGYDDGTYRPAGSVTRGAMAAFMYRLMDRIDLDPDVTQTFSDVGPNHPFYEEVEWLYDFGVLLGYPDGTFRPGAAVTRQSMASFLYRLAGAPAGPFLSDFSDVSTNHPFAVPISWMADAGISEGYADGTFRPASDVSRQAMSAFLRRFDDAGLTNT
jgi:hypothetical protein